MDIYQTANQMKSNHQTIYDINIRVAYYARVSTLREEQDSSVDNQINHFNDLITSHPNWTFVRGYVDRIRGESAANRANFMKMIEDGKSGEFDLILTKEVSRFARNTIDSLTYTRDLFKHGVGVLFENDNICTIDTDAEFRLTIMASIAQDEVRKLSERVKFGHKQSIQKGVVMGNSRIYGYDKNNGKLVINEKEAEMVRLIFVMYASGTYSLRAIERELYNRGYRSRNGNKIQHNAIKGIINNPKYKGYYCGNKVKIADYRTKEQVFLPKEEWVMYKDETGETVPAIVDESIWNTAYNLFVKRHKEAKTYNKGQKSTSALSGKIICGHHNTPFWRTSYSNAIHKDHNVYQWICREKRRGKSADCPTFAIYEYELYDLIKDLFMSVIGNMDDCIQEFMDIYKRNNEKEQANDSIIIYQKQLKKAENKKDKLLELYVDSAISKSDFKVQNERINDEITNIQEKIRNFSVDIPHNNDTSKVQMKLKSMCSGLSFENEDIDNFICSVISRIIVNSNDKTSMILNFVINDSPFCSIQYSH